jgi:uncharacterized lipoprotein YajG
MQRTYAAPEFYNVSRERETAFRIMHSEIHKVLNEVL